MRCSAGEGSSGQDSAVQRNSMWLPATFRYAFLKGHDMFKLLVTGIAATVLLAGCETGAQQSILLAETTVTGNITQNQSGNGGSQSISIGNTDGKPASGKKTKGGKLSSSQDDPETGNKQSADVSGSAKVRQGQDGRGNTQSADVNGSGNISQNQSGRGNSQSISIGGNTTGAGGTPSLTQSQTGANRKQSIKVDGKKVEMKDE